MQDLDLRLGEQPMFRGMTPNFLKQLAEYATIQKFESGKFIFRQNEDAEHCYVILEGKVHVELFSVDGGPLILQSLDRGDILGWSWLISPYFWRMDARAVENTEVIVLDAKRLRAKMEQDHEFGFELLKRFIVVVTQRLESARLELLSLYGTHT